jgi:hypothetical protein
MPVVDYYCCIIKNIDYNKKKKITTLYYYITVSKPSVLVCLTVHAAF